MTLWHLVIPVLVGIVLAFVWWAGKAMLEGTREGIQEANEELAQEKTEREAQQAEQTAARQQVLETAALSLGEAERFALNLRAPFAQLWIQIFEDAASGRPLEYFYQFTPPAGKEDELRQSLVEGWEIPDHASAIIGDWACTTAWNWPAGPWSTDWQQRWRPGRLPSVRSTG